jgi:hypothetical protein
MGILPHTLVKIDEIPAEFLKQELEFEIERLQNTGSGKIESKIQSIEKAINNKRNQ